MKRKSIILYTIVGLLFVLFIAYFIVRSNANQRLIDNYYRNKEEYNDLIKTFKADSGLEKVGKGFTRPSDITSIGLSSTKIDQYWQILKKLGLSEGIEVELIVDPQILKKKN